MAAVSRGGLNTLYALQQAVGLQPGSLSHVIRTLEKARFLVRSDGAKRGRRTMSLTEAGERFLADEWMKGLDPNREMESILRSVTVALLMDDVGEAINFLDRSASDRMRHRRPQEFENLRSGISPIELHAEMRAVHEGRRRAMESTVLTQLGEKLMEMARQREQKENQ